VISIAIAWSGVEHAVGGIIISGTDTLKSSGYFMYRQEKYSVLPTQCIYVFCMDLKTNSDYFPVQY